MSLVELERLRFTFSNWEDGIHGYGSVFGTHTIALQKSAEQVNSKRSYRGDRRLRQAKSPIAPKASPPSDSKAIEL